jgi:L-iditol 2-dehydrogenase
VIAAIFHGPGDVRIEERPDPAPAAGELLVAIDAALTCGTDAKAFRRGHPLLLGPPPAPFGHEWAGTVVAAGAGAPFGPGTRVTGANSAPCGACPACRRGDEPLCAHLLPLLNGAYAELLLVPAAIAAVNVHELPAGLDPALAAMCEPLACAMNGAEASGATAGERIAVLGRGALGRMLGAVLTGRGCEVRILGSGEPDPPDSPDRVVEAAGSAEAWLRAIRIVRPGGTVLLFGGLPRGTTVPVDAYRLHYEALTVRGAFHHAPRHVAAALAELTANPAPYAALLTHAFPLAEVARPLAMGAGLAPRDGLLKAIIRP